MNKFSPFCTMAGESVAICLVNSSEKLPVSNSFDMSGLKGAGVFLDAKSSQLIPSKNGCALTSLAPLAPKRFDGCFTSSLRMKSLANLENERGMGGLDLSMRFDISAGMFFSPSTVNGEAPVSSS